MLNLRLYLAQRISAMVMIPLVLGHLAVMTVAMRGGLSTAEILGRTQGSTFWFAFYGLFVAAVSVHGAIGLRVIVHEVTGLRGAMLGVFTSATGLLLAGLGMRAVWVVTWAG